ncbi:hypothetical protein [Paenibacillus beijingensis]|uniref:Uncharacterized protein n=1 Tax=Paenibacillus beijingensis TaxID=1126833 RepID=A0A0D5NEB1_9BACL|nr:hypothetical protein [Paenibacillus beijingensis]AJY73704.1 hypothetical protein VN24_02480 [Paenibacillus beijingensis]
MFDPTVFENLKVAFENQLYDLDNLAARIRITNRIDRLEMSVLSREFALQFTLAEQTEVTAEIRLEATLNDLAAEILEMSGETPGCALLLRFYLQIGNDVCAQCRQIEDIVRRIWQPDLPPVQTLSFVYDQDPAVYTDTIELKFNRKINEDQMGDITNLIDHVLQTLAELNSFTLNR